MKRIIWSRPAQNDLVNIDQYNTHLDLEYAARVGRTTIKTAIWLAGNPRIGQFVEDSDVRKWRVSKTDYLLLYREIPDGIAILRVRHAKENWRDEI